VSATWSLFFQSLSLSSANLNHGVSAASSPADILDDLVVEAVWGLGGGWVPPLPGLREARSEAPPPAMPSKMSPSTSNVP
jgi:hypothetical protein